MSAVQTLMGEHRTIECVLECLRAAASAAETDGRLDTESFRQCIEFFRGFADHSHHDKEEKILFPLLAAHGLSDGGPVGVMLAEHDQGRHLLKTMDLELDKENVEQSLGVLLGATCDFIELLSDHIQKEDVVLFPLAGQVLNDPEAEQLNAAVGDYEANPEHQAAREKYLQLARDLCSRWDVEFRSEQFLSP